MSIALRPYQTMAIEAFLASQLRRKLIVLSTGMGKTITGLALARKMNTRTLWLAHREELITQPAKSLKLVWPEASSGIVKAELNQYMKQVVFASIQSAQQERRAAQLVDEGFGLVVVDEAHHALSPGYVTLLDQLGCMTVGGPQDAWAHRDAGAQRQRRTERMCSRRSFSGRDHHRHRARLSRIAHGHRTLDQRSISTVTVARGDYGAKAARHRAAAIWHRWRDREPRTTNSARS
jgi:hypothetical protein